MKELRLILPLAFILCSVVGCQDKAAMEELESMKAQKAVEEANKAELKKLAENFQRAWDNRDMDALVRLYAEDATMFTPGAQEPMQGREAIKENEEALLRAMPDSSLEFTLALISEDHIVFEFVARGTFTGPLASPEGDIPPTGKSLEIKVAEIVRVNADGLIEEDRTYYDTMEFMSQLGLIE